MCTLPRFGGVLLAGEPRGHLGVYVAVQFLFRSCESLLVRSVPARGESLFGVGTVLLETGSSHRNKSMASLLLLFVFGVGFKLGTNSPSCWVSSPLKWSAQIEVPLSTRSLDHCEQTMSFLTPRSRAIKIAPDKQTPPFINQGPSVCVRVVHFCNQTSAFL